MADWKQHGLQLFHEGRYSEAIPYLEWAVQREPRDGNLHLCLGIALAALRELDRAQTHLLKAIQLRPQDPLAHYNWGCLLQQQGRYQEAIASYEYAARLDPSLTAAQIAAAQLRRSLSYPPSPPHTPAAGAGMTVPTVPPPAYSSESEGLIYNLLGLLCAFLALCCCPPLFGGVGIILGLIGMKKGGRTFGLAVIVLSVLCTGLGLLFGFLSGAMLGLRGLP